MTLTGSHRIAVVEDDPILRRHFSDIVSAMDRLDLSGAAGTLKEARGLLINPAHLFLIDIGLPDGSGLDFVAEIKAACSAKCLIVTSFGDRDMVVRAISAGADGYLLKDSEDIAMQDGIELTLAGGAPISASAAVYLLEHLRAAPPDVVDPATDQAHLTPREVELLQLFAKGFRYKEAAEILGISPLTIGNHVKSTYRKLAVNSRSEAVFEAVRAGHIKI